MGTGADYISSVPFHEPKGGMAMSFRKFVVFLAAAFLICIGFLLSFTPADGEETATNQLIIDVDLGEQMINKNIYGHFSEHLGGCIYGGYWERGY